MSCVRDIIATSGLAARVHIAYKNAPVDCRHISKEVAALQILIEKATPHLKGTTISSYDHEYGQKVLKGCRSVLQDLSSLIEKYNRLVSINKRLVLRGVKLGKEDITALQVRLISETVLLNGFIRSCEYTEVQAQLTAILGPNSRIPVNPIASFATNTDTNTAYKQFSKELERVGVTEVVLRQKEDKILEILGSHGMVASSESDDSGIDDQHQALEAAYSQFCEDLYKVGVTEAIMPPKAEILKILRSRGIGQTGSSNDIEDEDPDSSTQDLPSFRLSSRVDWFPTKLAGSLMPEALDNSSLLHQAAENSHISTMKLLFGKDALLDQGNNTFLHCAAACGYTNTVKLLLDKGAPIEGVNTDHLSPLHLATKYGHTSVVELLLEEGASVEAKDELNRTPLFWAAQYGYTGLVKLLLGKGAIIEAKGELGCTPLHAAIEKGHIGTVELLLGKGASLGALDEDNETPLHRAVAWGHSDIVELLLGKGVNIEAKGKFKRTPLNLAVLHGHPGPVELLLGKGALIEAKGQYGRTPLHSAAERGHTGLVELLLGKGASLGALDENKNTPLHRAASNGHSDIVELLLRRGASLEAKNKYSRTPLYLAEQNGHTDTVQLLKSKAAEPGGHRSRKRPSLMATILDVGGRQRK